jgi:predicted dehydrogenase
MLKIDAAIVASPTVTHHPITMDLHKIEPPEMIKPAIE